MAKCDTYVKKRLCSKQIVIPEGKHEMLYEDFLRGSSTQHPDISEDKKSENFPGYLVMRRKGELGDTMLNFYGDDERVYNQSYFKKFPKDTVRGYASEITIPVKDIDTVYKDAQEKVPDHIMKTLKETTDDRQSWRDFRLADPYSFYIRITEILDWGQ